MRDAAQSDSVDQPFVAGLDHRVQLAVEQFAVDFGRCVGITAAEYAQVDGGKSVGVQRAEVVFDALAKFVGLLCPEPRALIVALAAHLAHQHEVGGVGMQRLVDQFVGDVGPVEL